MPEIKIPTAEEINQQITEAIAASAIGEELQKTIAAEVEKLSLSWENPWKGVVDAHIRQEIAAILRADFGEQVREKIKERLTDERVDELLGEAFKERDW